MKPLIERLRHGVGDAVRDTALMNEAADALEAALAWRDKMTPFVVDTVGEVTNPAGETFRGVILALPARMSDADQKRALSEVARLWAGRVTLTPTPETEDM